MLLLTIASCCFSPIWFLKYRYLKMHMKNQKTLSFILVMLASVSLHFYTAWLNFCKQIGCSFLPLSIKFSKYYSFCLYPCLSSLLSMVCVVRYQVIGRKRTANSSYLLLHQLNYGRERTNASLCDLGFGLLHMIGSEHLWSILYDTLNG